MLVILDDGSLVTGGAPYFFCDMHMHACIHMHAAASCLSVHTVGFMLSKLSAPAFSLDLCQIIINLPSHGGWSSGYAWGGAQPANAMCHSHATKTTTMRSELLHICGRQGAVTAAAPDLSAR